MPPRKRCSNCGDVYNLGFVHRCEPKRQAHNAINDLKVVIQELKNKGLNGAEIKTLVDELI